MSAIKVKRCYFIDIECVCVPIYCGALRALIWAEAASLHRETIVLRRGHSCGGHFSWASFLSFLDSASFEALGAALLPQRTCEQPRSRFPGPVIRIAGQPTGSTHSLVLHIPPFDT